MSSGLTAADLAQLAAHGIDEAEAQRQLALFRKPPSPAPLVRACTLGDGIRALSSTRNLETAYRGAVRAGRLTKFVPASGAASRMFKALSEAREADDPAENEAYRQLEDSLDDFPFADRLSPRVRTSARALLDAILDEAGLGLALLPKGLVPFHRRDDGPARTPFEEHLLEAVHLFGHDDGRAVCRLHFTVSPEHRAKFEEQLERSSTEIESKHQVKLEVGFSAQSPATDTLAVDEHLQPFRTEAGELLLRPGGHGALIGNLDALGKAGGDLVTIKNVDNILPGDRQEEANRVKRSLIGLLVELESSVHDLLASLAGDPSPDDLEQAREFLERELGQKPCSDSPWSRAQLIRRLDRPLRICGMVVNRGEPGGGPFWVEDRERGEAPQIVESAQIDTGDETQARILATATHFNPVELICSLRDWRGRAFDLERFVNHESWFLAEKSMGGRSLKALERPGLWNGAMGGWNTIFVEVPASTFAPVKTVFDLLRPEHARS